jgi:hypothetical protein
MLEAGVGIMKRVGDLVEPFVPCANCVNGWVEVLRPWGTLQVPSQTRCACWKVHQDRILRAITDVAESQRKKKI